MLTLPIFKNSNVGKNEDVCGGERNTVPNNDMTNLILYLKWFSMSAHKSRQHFS